MTQSIDRFVERMALGSANRQTRRGFFGRVGGATAALATAGMVVAVEDAEAVCPNTSVTCVSLYGAGHNYCSANTCTDGSWTIPAGTCDSVAQCGSGFTRWRDCCATPTCGCHQVNGHPSCCNPCIYHGGGGGACQRQHDRVRCRYWACS